MPLAPDTPDLAALDILLSVAELGSLGQAARRHGISQPAVSMRMAHLEHRLGLQLLSRSATGTQLTPAGVAVSSHSARVIEAATALLGVVHTLRAEVDQRLRVAASLTVADHLMPGWLVLLHDALPDLRVALEVTNSTAVLSLASEGEVDVGFVEGLGPPKERLASRVVGGDHLVVVVRPDHPWASRDEPLTAGELARTALILREPASGTRQVLEAALASYGGVRSRLELGSTAAILGAACRGEGPAVVSSLAAARDLEQGRLFRVELAGVALDRSFRAVWPALRPLNPAARRLVGLARSPERDSPRPQRSSPESPRIP